ncbi:TetR/AcrR family transcriptional regulator [Amycolatopsis keratiniphila]|uniref:TetR family transcriptional regulator n=1 Tax=Amycolatopsis keratiniphila TaxID=129921 RepID=R4SU80_9PSEU|nr:TetR/AcrR family transcriptional regulator [Amycolatopsis keratiniphila]AGM06110.1 TetR family transcriptional regulator [Amycolatopsis keratiniphila]
MDPRKERTIAALLRAADEVFRERPVDDVTVEEIAERANVAVGSLYNHFGSKAGLHAAVVERALQADREYMDRAYVPGRTPIEQLYAAADEYLAFYLANPDYFRMLAFPREPGGYAAGHELAERLARSVAEQNARLVRALREGVEAGDLRDIDAEEAATVLWAAWNGVISLGWRPDALRRDEKQLRRLLTVATEIAAKGLLVR